MDNNAIFEAQIQIERARAACGEVAENYFSAANPDPRNLAFYHDHYATLLHITLDYIIRAQETLEAAMAKEQKKGDAA